jgi:hypothetical protein
MDAIRLFNGFVESVSINAGYGVNSSTCQLSLVYESDGPNRGNDLNISGVGVNPFEANFPPLGTAVGISVGECDFIGLFQRYVNNRSISGYKWDIVLESPAKLLEGIQIILGEFQGTAYTGANPGNPSAGEQFTSQINNVWNPFAVLENFNYGGRFGRSDVNSNGFPALDFFDYNGNQVKGALTLIEEISRGEHPYGGPARFGVSQFKVDLTELKDAVSRVANAGIFGEVGTNHPAKPNPKFIRVKGPVQSLAGVIQELCDLIMYDFLVVLEPESGPVTNGIINDLVLKIRMIDKSNPPDPNVVKSMVDKYERDDQLISADIGKELSDAVTQKLVIGGPATRYYVTNNIIQIWGKTRDFVPRYVNFIVLEDGSFYFPDELEVRCAMSSRETWILYHLIKRYKGESNPYVSSLGDALFSHVRINDYVMNKIFNGEIEVNDLLDTSINTAMARGQIYNGVDPKEQLDRLFDAIAASANEYYRRRFFVPLPMEPGGISNNIRFITEDQNYETSWEIADAAWYASVEGGVLDENSRIRDVSFYDDSGRLRPTATWIYDPMRADYSQLGSNYCNTPRGIASVINVEKEIYWIGNQAYAVVDIPNVNYIDQLTTEQNGLFKLLNAMLNVPAGALQNIANIGAENGPLGYSIINNRIPPLYIGIPQISTRYRWGPWWGWKSKLGKAEVLIEDTLTPETYGGMVAANQVGFTYAAVENAEIAGVESGSVELAGLPIGNIGTRFAVSGPYVTSIGISVGTGGITTNYKFNTWTPQFGKLAKYNIDRLANINKNYIRVVQAQRSLFTKPVLIPPKFKENKIIGVTPQQMFAGGGFLGASLNNGKLNMSGQNVSNVLASVSKDNTNTYGMSIEQLQTPVIISKELPSEQTGPEFIKAKETNDKGKFDQEHVSPTSKELNPYFALGDCDFQLAVNGDQQAQSLAIKEIGINNINKVRPLGFRGPLILSGWGFDMNDMPVPSAGNSGNDRFEFNDEAGVNRNIWKTGPVDLRWDDERKVWGSGFRIIEGVLTTSITAASSPSAPSTFTISVRRTSQWSDIEEEVTVHNRDPSLKVELNNETTGKILVVAIKVNYEWRPIWVGCPDNL